jgi:diguanylate cyclase (GGDEF)-like protein
MLRDAASFAGIPVPSFFSALVALLVAPLLFLGSGCVQGDGRCGADPDDLRTLQRIDMLNRAVEKKVFFYPETALREIAESLRLCRRVTYHKGQAEALSLRGRALLLREEVEKSLDSHVKAVARAQKCGDHEVMVRTRAWLASALVAAGRTAAARSELARARALHGDRQERAAFDICLASAALAEAEADPEKQRDWLLQAQETAKRIGDREAEGHAVFLLARYRHQVGDEAGALADVDAAIKVFEAINCEPGKACCLLFRGARLKQAACFFTAIEAAEQAIGLLDRLALNVHLADAHKLVGDCHYAVGRLDKCLEHYNIALKIYDKLKRDSLVDETTVDIIRASIFLDDRQKAVDYAYQLLDDGKQKTDLVVAKLYTNITLATFMDFPEKAAETARKALLFADKAGAMDVKVDALSLLGHCLIEMGSFAEALECLQQARSIVEKRALKEKKNQVYNDLARYYYLRGDLDRSWKCAEEALSFAKDRKIFIGEYIAYTILHDICAQRGDFAAADDYSQKIISLSRDRCKDKLVQAQKAQTIKYDLRVRDKEIELLKKEKALQELYLSRQTMITAFVAIGMLLAVGLAVAVWLAYRNNTRALRVEARLSRRDPLTQLLNRRAMYEELENEVERWRRNHTPFSVVLADIDHFKGYNDRYGHDCGDMVLLRVAEILRTTLRKQDRVARWGGEEFLVMLPETDSAGAVNLAEKLRLRFEGMEFACYSERFCVTVSFGVAQYVPDVHIDATVKVADAALYRAKSAGRNRVEVGGEKDR